MAVEGSARPVRVRIEVRGIVQGVGFRPFVHAVADELGLAGLVGNDARGAFVEAEGPAAAVEALVERIRRHAPPLAVVDDVVVHGIALAGDEDFAIVPSRDEGARSALVSPDAGPCVDCLREVADHRDRRRGYPFVNCTNCGPRFTIIRQVPYDRANTTMAGFAMCAACRAEYEDPADRRFHAQPVCCPVCGPRLSLLGPDGEEIAGDAVAGVARLLEEGAVVAVKGVGGFHLAVDASSEEAVARLRARKHRGGKPFALLVASVDAVRSLCVVDGREAALLASPERPVVLLRRRTDAAATVAESVAPGNRHLGVMLPPSPLHALVVDAFGGPLVLTSGNRADEPIAFRDADALGQLAGIADAFCTHDRPIHVRADDSVVRVVGGRALPVRRARGYAPRPVQLLHALRRDVLGVGAHLKSTVCLASGRHAFVSQHLGDLVNPETYRSFVEAITHHRRLFDIHPEVVAHDLHPDYLSTAFATELADVEAVPVQHHHAHIASCLVDNGHDGPVIGVAFDGLGLGTDGSAWGGELLVADLCEFRRVGHLRPVAMPGADRATREPWRMAAAHLVAAQGADDGPAGVPDVARRNHDRWDAVTQLARSGLRAPPTSSVGRLFDAVAAVLGVRDAITYEGQAAIELEQLADPAEQGRHPVRITDGDPFVVEGSDLVTAAVADLDVGVPPAAIAARFHNSVVDLVCASCERVRAHHDLDVVALSGGVFQNRFLVERLVPALGERGFSVLTHRRVPPNDGGISLGQVAVAGARDRRR